MSAPRKNKFGAVRTTLDGITFDSKREAAYYAELKLRERAGEVADVEIQKPFLLSHSAMVIGTYRSDFSFFDAREGKHRVIDVKGKDTPLSKWKRKHVLAQYGILVEVVR